MPLILRRLQQGDEGTFLRAHSLTIASDPNFAPYYRAGLPFSEYLGVLDDARRGLRLPDGHVPSTLLFGLVDDQIVGRLMLRHTLSESLLRVGGHIGYVVVAEQRRRGYATAMLEQGLARARSRGLTRVLITCDEDNIASRRVIERCGGQYESSSIGPETSVEKRRYWISLPP